MESSGVRGCLMTFALVLTMLVSAPAGTATQIQIDALVTGQDVLPALATVQADAETALQLPSSEEVQGWTARARLRGLLPQLDVRFGSQRDLSIRDTAEGLDWARSGQGLGLNIAARWGLGALLLSDVEMRMHNERLRRSAAVRLARTRVTELYFERIEVLLALRTEGTPTLWLEAARLDGLLAALTGGRYRLRASP